MAFTQAQPAGGTKPTGGFTPVSTSNPAAQMFGAKPTASAFSTPEVAGADVSSRGLFSSIGNALTRNEQAFGQTLGDAAAAVSPSFGAALESDVQLSELNSQLGTTIAKKKLKGEDTTNLERIYQDNVGSRFDLNEILPSADKSAKEIFGEGLGVFLDIASAGSYGKAVQGAGSFQFAKRVPRITASVEQQAVGRAFAEAYQRMPMKDKVWTQLTKIASGFKKAAPTGAIFGGSYGLSTAMQNDATFKEALSDVTSGAIVGSLASGVISGLSERAASMRFVKAAKMEEAALASYLKGFNLTKQKAREDLQHIAPHLIEEGWWGSKASLYQKAINGQEISRKQYEELGELMGAIDTEDLQQIDDMLYKEMKKLTAMPRSAAKVQPGMGETATDALVGSVERGETKIRAEADTAYKALLDLRADVHHLLEKGYGTAGEGPGVRYEDLRQLARGYGDTLYESRKALSLVKDNAALSQMLKMDSIIRGIVSKANPKYAEINKLYHMSGEMLDILNESSKVQENFIDSMMHWRGTMAALVGLVGYGASSQGGAVKVAVGATAISGLSLLLHSTWFTTMNAVSKSQVAIKLSTMAPESTAAWIHLLNGYGPKAAEALINEQPDELVTEQE